MFSLTLITCLALRLPPVHNVAEQLLLEMDARITAARTLRVEFEIHQESGRKSPITITGSMLLADRNRFRHDVVISLYSSPERTLLVSDGRRISGVQGGTAMTPPPPLRVWHNEVLRAWLGRGGTFLAMSEVLGLSNQSLAGKPGPAAGPKVSDVRLLPDEEINGVKARVVEYVLSWKVLQVFSPMNQKATVARVRLWIDPTTKLPMRRRIAEGADGLGMAFIATHSRFEIDPKLDDALFVIPK